EIGRQAGLRLMYGEDVLSATQQVTLYVRNAGLQEVLEAVLHDTGLVTRAVASDALLIKRGDAPVLPPVRQGTLTGQVTDATTQQPLSGASIVVVGTDHGSLTGGDGRFTISGVPEGTHQVRVNMIGYAPQEQGVTIAAGATETVNFSLEPSAVQLEGIVAVGYATERERNVSGAITTVRAEDLNTVSSLSVNQMMRGRAPGLNLTTRS